MPLVVTHISDPIRLARMVNKVDWLNCRMVVNSPPSTLVDGEAGFLATPPCGASRATLFTIQTSWMGSIRSGSLSSCKTSFTIRARRMGSPAALRGTTRHECLPVSRPTGGFRAIGTTVAGYCVLVLTLSEMAGGPARRGEMCANRSIQGVVRPP